LRRPAAPGRGALGGDVRPVERFRGFRQGLGGLRQGPLRPGAASRAIPDGASRAARHARGAPRGAAAARAESAGPVARHAWADRSEPETRFSCARSRARSDGERSGGRRATTAPIRTATAVSAFRANPYSEADAMNDGILFERINTIPPLINTSTNKRQAAIAVTDASTATNLAALIPKVVNGHYVELTADGADIYYAFADSDSAEVDPEATADDPKVCQE